MKTKTNFLVDTLAYCSALLIVSFLMSMNLFSQEKSSIASASDELNKGNYTKAESDYTKVIEKNKSYAPAFYGRGLALSYQAKYDAAIEDFLRAISLESNHHKAYYACGLCYMRKGEYRQAAQSFEKALEFDNNPDYTYSTACAYYYLGEYSQAEVYFDRTLKINNDYALAYYGLGASARIDGKSKEAASFLERYLSLAGNHDGLESEAQRIIKDIKSEEE